jgi:hypothetical protein
MFEIFLELNRNIKSLSENVVENTSAVNSFKSRIAKVEEQQAKNTAWINIARGTIALAMSVSGLLALLHVVRGII